MFVPGKLSMQSAFTSVQPSYSTLAVLSTQRSFTSVQPSYSTLFTQGAFIPLQPGNLASFTIFNSAT